MTVSKSIEKIMTTLVFLHSRIGLSFAKETKGRALSQLKKNKVNIRSLLILWVLAIQSIKLVRDRDKGYMRSCN